MISYLISRLCITMIILYRYLLSMYLGNNCRFQPTCSQYALECYQQFNVIKASYLTLRRLLKCHPWGKYGYDPVVVNKKSKNI